MTYDPNVSFGQVAGKFILLLCLSCASSTSQQKDGENTQADVPSFEDPVAILNQSELDLSVRRQAINQIIQEDQAKAPELLLAACKKEASLLLEEVVNYFGEKKYLPAIPLIEKALAAKNNNTEFIYSCFFALAQMENDDADTYVLEACQKANQAEDKSISYQYQCLLVLHDTKNKLLKKKAIPIFRSLAKFSAASGEKKDSKLQKLVMDFLKANNEKESHQQAFLPRAAPNPPVAKPSLSPLLPSAVPSKKPKQKVYKASSSRRIQSILAKKLGSQKASRLLLERIDGSLKTHAKRKGDISDFLVRSYKRHSLRNKLNTKQAQGLLEKGISYPGSLKAIVKNVKREYASKALRAYSLSKIFKIPRSQAKLLLNL